MSDCRNVSIRPPPRRRWRFGPTLRTILLRLAVWRNSARCKKLFEEAAHIVGITLQLPRVIPNPIETRGAIGLYDAKADRFTLVSNPQGVHFVRSVLTQALGLPEEKLRVVAPYLGGAFGSNIYAYPEHALVLLAARAIGRPVRWTATRSEAFLS